MQSAHLAYAAPGAAAVVAALEPFDYLTVRQARILAFLFDNDGVSSGRIVQALAMPKPAVSRNVARLVEGGMVRHRGDRNDLRLNVLTLTPGGRAVVEASVAAMGAA